MENNKKEIIKPLHIRMNELEDLVENLVKRIEELEKDKNIIN